MSLRTLLLLPGLTLALSACAMNPPPSPERPSLHPAGPLTEGSAPTSLQAAIDLALENNPALRAEYARFEAMLLDVPQVSSLDDPMVMVSQQEAFRGPGDERENMLTLSQTFPWFGKRELRGRIARTDAFEILEEYRASALDVRRDVIIAWHELAYEQANRALTIAERDLLQQTLQATLSLYETGRADRGTLLRAQTEIARAEAELPVIEARIEARRRELARLMGVEEPALDIDQATLSGEDLPRIPTLEVVLAEAITHRPELEGLRRREEAAELAQRLARADYYPDFTVGIGMVAMGEGGGDFYTPDSDDRTDSWQASVGINIPIPNARRRAATRQAEHRIEEAGLRQQAVADAILEEIHSISASLQALERQRGTFRDTILILAQDAYDAADTSYRVGRINLVELIDVQRTLIATRRETLSIERDHHLAVAELERAMGMPLYLVPAPEETQP